MKIKIPKFWKKPTVKSKMVRGKGSRKSSTSPDITKILSNIDLKKNGVSSLAAIIMLAVMIPVFDDITALLNTTALDSIGITSIMSITILIGSYSIMMSVL